MREPSPDWSAEDALDHLRMLASAENRAGMARFGINTGNALGVGNTTPPSSLANGLFLGVSYWDWLAGPSIAMCVFILMAVFTTSGPGRATLIRGTSSMGWPLSSLKRPSGGT